MGGGGTNPVDVGVTAVIGGATRRLINPTRSTGAEGAANVFDFYIRHLDGASSVIDVDTARGRIAVVEAVRVTAIVDPTLTFTIDNTGVGQGASVCGNTLGSNASATTATTVSYGSVSLGAFNDLAQRLSCVTNSTGGYVVTVYEQASMANISTGTTITDTNCDGACSTATAAPWTTDNANSEWGYSIQNINVGTTIFHYTQGYKPFGIGSANAREIMKNTTTPTASEQAYICYRLTASTSQEAGKYENKLVFTATATF